MCYILIEGNRHRVYGVFFGKRAVAKNAAYLRSIGRYTVPLSVERRQVQAFMLRGKWDCDVDWWAEASNLWKLAPHSAGFSWN